MFSVLLHAVATVAAVATATIQPLMTFIRAIAHAIALHT